MVYIEIEIEIKKIHLYILSGLIAVLAIAIFAFADDPAPDVLGHIYKDLDLGILGITEEEVTVSGSVDMIDRDITANNLITTIMDVEGDLKAPDNLRSDCVWMTIPASSYAECSDGKYAAGFRKPTTGTWSMLCCEL